MNIETQTPNMISAQLAYPPYEEDEISLVDLWIDLTAYKKHFFTVLVLSLAALLSFTFFMFENKYALESTIQIGNFERQMGIYPIEEAESLISKIESSMIPAHTRRWLAQKDLGNKEIRTKVVNPKDTNVVLISNKARESEIALFESYHQGLVEVILKDHQSLINSLTAGLTTQLEVEKLQLEELRSPINLNLKLKSYEIALKAEKIKLKKLQDENFFGIQKKEFKNNILRTRHDLDQLKYSEGLLKEQLARVEETRQILHRNIKELSLQIKESLVKRVKAVEDTTPLSAMPQLLIDNEIQQNQARLLSLEERYYVTSENQKSEILTRIEENRLNQLHAGKNLDVLIQKYDQMLLDNRINQDNQQLAIEQAEMAIEKVKFDHQNSIAKQQQAIHKTQTLLSNYNETRVVSTAVPTFKPVGMTQHKLAIISVVIALFFASIGVLLFMFFHKVRQRREDLML